MANQYKRRAMGTFGPNRATSTHLENPLDMTLTQDDNRGGLTLQPQKIGPKGFHQRKKTVDTLKLRTPASTAAHKIVFSGYMNGTATTKNTQQIYSRQFEIGRDVKTKSRGTRELNKEIE